MVLGIYGAGGNGKTVADLARYIEREGKRWEKLVFIDDVTDQKEIYGIEVYSFEEALSIFSCDEIRFVISNGEPADRELLYRKIKGKNYKLETLVNPKAWVPEGTKIGEGCILGLCSIGSDTIIGNNTFISQDAIVGHDTLVGDNTIISAGSFVAGHCAIGNKVYVGPRAVLRDRIKIEDTAVIAIGAVVFKDVPGNMIALGNPAKHIRKEENYRIFG